MFSHKSLFSVAALAATLAACGGSTGSKGDAGRKIDEIDTSLTGNWLSNCVQKGPLGIIPIASERELMQFGVAQGDITKTIHRFDDTACNNALYDQDIVGTYSLVGDSTTAAGAQNVNINIHSTTIKPATEAAAGKLNEAKFCGATDWANGVAKDVTGADCGGKKFSQGDVVFDLVKRDHDTLFLGKASFFNDGTSAGERPTALDTDHPLAKQ
jgi:hypothetical protein